MLESDPYAMKQKPTRHPSIENRPAKRVVVEGSTPGKWVKIDNIQFNINIM